MNAEDGLDIERRLVAHARSTGPLRTAMAEIADWLVARKSRQRLGYARLSDYAGERTDLSARSLYDLAHVSQAACGLPRLRATLIQGTLAWTKVRLIARVATHHDEQHWIEHARGFTLRRLRDDVERALLMSETDWQAWLQTGGLPEEDRAQSHEEENHQEAHEDLDGVGEEGEFGANQTGRKEGCRLRAFVDSDVRRLARAVLSTVWRRIERLTGRLPTEGEAFGVMLDHALQSWAADQRKLRQ